MSAKIMNMPSALPQPSFRHWTAVVIIAAILHITIAAFIFKDDPVVSGQAENQGIGGINIGLGMQQPDSQIMQRLKKPIPQSDVSNKHPTEPTTESQPITEISPASNTSSVKISNKESPDSQIFQQHEETLKKIIPSALIATDDDNDHSNQLPAPAPPHNTEQQAENSTQAMEIKAPEATGRSADAQSGGQQGEIDVYMQKILSWLNRFKHYPTKAKRRKEKGIAYIEFSMLRDGKVTDASIYRSSGSDILDKAALNVLRTASPLPAIPDNIFPEENKIIRIIPIDYSFITR